MRKIEELNYVEIYSVSTKYHSILQSFVVQVVSRLFLRQREGRNVSVLRKLYCDAQEMRIFMLC